MIKQRKQSMYVRPTLTGLPSSSAEGGLAHFVWGDMFSSWGERMNIHYPAEGI